MSVKTCLDDIMALTYKTDETVCNKNKEFLACFTECPVDTSTGLLEACTWKLMEVDGRCIRDTTKDLGGEEEAEVAEDFCYTQVKFLTRKLFQLAEQISGCTDTVQPEDWDPGLGGKGRRRAQATSEWTVLADPCAVPVPPPKLI
jgi:hypothetical protein